MPELVLEPLILPSYIDSWQPAIGWWIALTALLIGLLFGLSKFNKNTNLVVAPTPLTAREEALQALKLLQRPYNEQPAMEWLQQLNQLLKRLCVANYPNANVQTLTGKDWLVFLDSRCTAAGLSRWMVLVDGIYRPTCTLSNKAIDELNQAISIWIERHV
ncbi:DUF4381 domain-containing protein [Pseudomonas sp. F1_0610]|uniref:DUF4381 domain-containing protein n=1 Tax=Pseudomonas sp. F1_0610 TaxID=3114284 RepID=UPI0039C27C1E